MRGLVLAAGFGTRLQPITEVLPKALVSVCGVPLVEIALRYFRKAGLENLAINMHYQAELTEMFVDQLPYKVTKFDEQPTILGTGGAIYNAESFLSEDASFAVLNADIVTNAPLLQLKKEFEESDALVALITADSGDPTLLSKDGIFNGRLREPLSEGGEGSAFIGLALYKREALPYFKQDDFDVVTTWSRMVELGEKVVVWKQNNIYWQDTGTPKDLGQLYWDILDRKLSFDFPLGMNVDFDRRVAWSKQLDRSVLTPDASYMWVEQVLGDNISGNRSILHGGVMAKENHTYDNQLVTPWCEVSLA